jgi:hypothetical protein
LNFNERTQRESNSNAPDRFDRAPGLTNVECRSNTDDIFTAVS